MSLPLLKVVMDETGLALHPKLSSLSGMMTKLSYQVAPEYGRLETQPPQEHLHEAFRRILLEQILSMNDPIPLTPDLSRNPIFDAEEDESAA